jgi:hypothetical protein
MHGRILDARICSPKGDEVDLGYYSEAVRRRFE